MAVTIDGSANTVTADATLTTKLTTASGSAPSYSARAWVNFNGTGTVAIRESGNVSSITDGGVGLYGINFTTAMEDVNYGANATASRSDVSTQLESICSFYSYAVGSVSLITQGGTGIDVDTQFVNVSIFR